MHNKTYLPDKRAYETFTNKEERDRKYYEIKNNKGKVEIGSYNSINGMIYFIIYKE